MGAGTFTRFPNVSEGILDNKRVVKGQVQMSASYSTGGETLDLKTVGLTELRQVLVETSSATLATGGYSIRLGGTPNAPTLLVFDANGAEVAAATNLSARNPIGVWLIGS